MQIKGTPKQLKKYFKLMQKIEKNLLSLSRKGVDLTKEVDKMWKDKNGKVYYAYETPNLKYQVFVVGLHSPNDLNDPNNSTKTIKS